MLEDGVDPAHVILEPLLSASTCSCRSKYVKIRIDQGQQHARAGQRHPDACQVVQLSDCAANVVLPPWFRP